MIYLLNLARDFYKIFKKCVDKLISEYYNITEHWELIILYRIYKVLNVIKLMLNLYVGVILGL